VDAVARELVVKIGGVAVGPMHRVAQQVGESVHEIGAGRRLEMPQRSAAHSARSSFMASGSGGTGFSLAGCPASASWA
jgi:hypothetical protein